jgi:hypothetical protein
MVYGYDGLNMQHTQVKFLIRKHQGIQANGIPMRICKENT